MTKKYCNWKFILYTVIILYFLNPFMIFVTLGIVMTTYVGVHILIVVAMCILYTILWYKIRESNPVYEKMYYWKFIRPTERHHVVKNRTGPRRRKEDKLIDMMMIRCQNYNFLKTMTDAELKVIQDLDEIDISNKAKNVLTDRKDKRTKAKNGQRSSRKSK